MLIKETTYRSCFFFFKRYQVLIPPTCNIFHKKLFKYLAIITYFLGIRLELGQSVQSPRWCREVGYCFYSIAMAFLLVWKNQFDKFLTIVFEYVNIFPLKPFSIYVLMGLKKFKPVVIDYILCYAGSFYLKLYNRDEDPTFFSMDPTLKSKWRNKNHIIGR